MQPPAGVLQGRDGRAAYLAGVGVLSSVVCTYVLVAAGLLVGVPVNGTSLVAGLVLGTLFAAMAARRVSSPTIEDDLAAAAVTALVLIGAAVGLASAFYDVSSDGQEYHQSAIVALTEGWNPTQQVLAERDSTHHLWLNYYPKAAWFLAAASMRLGSSLEGSKAIAGVLAGAAFLLLYAAMSGGLGRARAAIVGALAALNPVTVSQLTSFYIDGQVASIWLAACALAILWTRDPGWVTEIPLAGSFVYLVGLKYTGVVFVAVIGAVGVLSLWRHSRRGLIRRWATTCGAGLVLGTCVVGYNPYLTNLARQGNPFYLLIGEDAFDYVSDAWGNGCCVPPGFGHIDRFRGLAASLVAASENNYGYAPVRYKVPFTVDARELRDFVLPDVRLGGWGPFLGGACILAALAWGLRGRWEDKRYAPIAVGLLVMQVGAALALPYPWWARYAPMMAFVPVVVLAYVWIGRKTRLTRGLGAALAVTLAVNNGLVLSAHAVQQIAATRAVRTQLVELAAAPTVLEVRAGSYESVPRRLRDKGVRFREVAALSCEPEGILFSGATFCTPEAARPVVQAVVSTGDRRLADGPPVTAFRAATPP